MVKQKNDIKRWVLVYTIVVREREKAGDALQLTFDNSTDNFVILLGKNIGK